ncbi:MAG: catechol 1,2-dioxygenase [Verrucomicrobia bacterium]|nr:catechol 1,2-dioxygenase [Verrucomicrobiota bacterium]
MSVAIINTTEVQQLLDAASGLSSQTGDTRAKEIVHRILSDLCKTIEDLNVTPDELWAGVDYLNDLGRAGEAALLTAGFGLEHFLDLRLDAEEALLDPRKGTSRTIEGPLYVEGAPMSKGFARLDDGTEQGKVLIMHGLVHDINGRPIAGGIVDVWHANTKGLYSHFDKSQPPFNLRRRIETDENGRYEFQSIVPSGYGCPPDGPTQALLSTIGRHGRRPAHIHFFVYAPGYQKLTTQINIAGDPLLHDDFAFATRDDLIPDVVERADPESIKAKGLPTPFVEVEFDFVLRPASDPRHGVVMRRRAAVG